MCVCVRTIPSMMNSQNASISSSCYRPRHRPSYIFRRLLPLLLLLLLAHAHHSAYLGERCFRFRVFFSLSIFVGCRWCVCVCVVVMRLCSLVACMQAFFPLLSIHRLCIVHVERERQRQRVTALIYCNASNLLRNENL